MVKTLIIGLLGESKTGKDWLGELLNSRLNPSNLPITRLKCADKVKQEAERQYPGIFDTKIWEASGDDYREVIVPSINMSRRHILQTIGPELLEDNPKYVYEYLRGKISSGTHPYVYIEDVRNSTECQGVIDSGGIVIKITRSYEDRYPDLWRIYTENLTSSTVPTPKGFVDSLEHTNPKMFRKFIHPSETSVEEVSPNDYTFLFNNISDNTVNKRNFNSLLNSISLMKG